MKTGLQRFEVFAVAMLLILFISLPQALSVQAADTKKKANDAVKYDYMDIKVKVDSPTKTKISWKKKKVDKYVIYEVKDDGNTRKKVATLPGSRTSYTIKTKKNQYYSFEIKGRKYKKGSKKLTHEYYGDAWFYSGVSPVNYDDYCYAEGYISTKKIELSFGPADDGLTPDGYQIYRKKSSAKKFTKVGSVSVKNKKDKWAVWKDKDVKAHKSYVYKVRAYKKIGKKNVYGPFSEEMAKRAVNMNGKYTVNGDPDADEPVLKVTGNKNNGILSIYPEGMFNCGYVSDTDENVCYLAKAISHDGKNWYSLETYDSDGEDEFSVEGNESFWLKFSKEELAEEYWDDNTEENLSVNGHSYEGIPVYFDLYPYTGTARTFRDSESIH